MITANGWQSGTRPERFRNPVARSAVTNMATVSHSRGSAAKTGEEAQQMTAASARSLRPKAWRTIVCGLLGVDSANYSFGCVAGWGGGDDAIKRIRESRHPIQQTAQQMVAELLPETTR